MEVGQGFIARRTLRLIGKACRLTYPGSPARRETMPPGAVLETSVGHRVRVDGFELYNEEKLTMRNLRGVDKLLSLSARICLEMADLT